MVLVKHKPFILTAPGVLLGKPSDCAILLCSALWMSTWGWSKGALPRRRPAGTSPSQTGGCSSPAQVRMGARATRSAWGLDLFEWFQPDSSRDGVGTGDLP